ncbi:hypothetical protein SD81_021195 [Tolypothrix campylonemoides VB511288]|nr:hypothetical protein SD81_021195 [Tolypothrix campylonemoides VB511288]
MSLIHKLGKVPVGKGEKVPEPVIIVSVSSSELFTVYKWFMTIDATRAIAHRLGEQMRDKIQEQ